MKYNDWDIGGEVVKEDSRYTVTDNTNLNNLVVSRTRLRPNRSTKACRTRRSLYIYERHWANGT